MEKKKHNFGCKLNPDWRWATFNGSIIVAVGDACTAPKPRPTQKDIDELKKQVKFANLKTEQWKNIIELIRFVAHDCSQNPKPDDAKYILGSIDAQLQAVGDHQMQQS